MEKLGIGCNKSKICYVSKHIPENLISYFIRGVIMGDGGFFISRRNSINIHIASPIKSFLEEIQEIINKNCNLQGGNFSFKNNCWKLAYLGNIQVKRIFDYVFDGKGPILNRKYYYALVHFHNLKKGIKIRHKNDPPIDQYKWMSELPNLE